MNVDEILKKACITFPYIGYDDAVKLSVLAVLPDIVEACAKVPEEIADGLGKYKLVVGNERKDACNWLQEAARRIRALAPEKRP